MQSVDSERGTGEMDREKLIQQARAEGVPLHKIEEHLDWLENVERERAKRTSWGRLPGAASRILAGWFTHLLRLWRPAQ